MYGSASSSRADSLDYDAGSSMPPPAPTSIIPTGPARKQNVACDACRSKKVRCQRLTINEKCAQCLGRGSECTSNYIEQLHAKQKKGRRPRVEGTKKRRREGEADTDEEVEAEPDQVQFEGYGASQNLSTFSTYIEGETSRISGGMNGAEESAQ
ncbi:hypothetical protein BCR39DRAFT_208345 [Naematelia encephala]|uniref:Zn(2)-C6 fungal-type domain-containing protein n=1 Tax=Naematelia encephala TaxID=71784 RepID=A0A1Y2B1A0_9TREE|nr:hypothetical protein BCR39DRAFT_208345 [Naematelia encephala]